MFVALFAVLLVCGSARVQAGPISLGMGQMSGEPTTCSIVLQARLTDGMTLVNGDLPGRGGWGRFEVADNAGFRNSKFTEWIEAQAEGDFMLKRRVDGLRPDTRYCYRLHYGATQAEARPGPAAAFRTLGGSAGTQPVKVVVVTGMNYSFFHEGTPGKPAYTGPDKALGFPALAHIAKLRPDYFVGTGDNVYYDHPASRAAQTLDAMRRKWHEQFQQPRYHELFARTATWWEKDDHDFRYNDCDLTGDKGPSVELGGRVFMEQMPLADPGDKGFVPYRTFRISKDLQIWLTEGRDFRSPNAMPDGPDKTMWGAEQLAWLKRTLKASDATFKVLISPTPLVGPDTAAKRDNHVNLKGFRTEGRTFIDWLKAEGLLERNFYAVCGDRHWQYHAIDPSGLEEFSCGSLVAQNAVVGNFPGDKKSTDPEGKIKHLHHPGKPMAGFLEVSIKPGEGSRPAAAVFNFYDDSGRLSYTAEKTAR